MTDNQNGSVGPNEQQPITSEITRSIADVIAAANAEPLARLREHMAEVTKSALRIGSVHPELAQLLGTTKPLRSFAEPMSAQWRELINPPAPARLLQQWKAPLAVSPGSGIARQITKAFETSGPPLSLDKRIRPVTFPTMISAAAWEPPLGHNLANLRSVTELYGSPASHHSSMKALLGDSTRSLDSFFSQITAAATGPRGESSVLGSFNALTAWKDATQRSLAAAMKQWAMPGISDWMTTAVRAPHEVITTIMQSWSKLAGAGHWAAQTALRVALAARRAVERGDIDTVKHFLREWLGFRKLSPDLINSASLVLLDTQRWLPDELLDLDYDPRPKLRSLTLAEHRQSARLITDPTRPLNGGTVLSLDTQVSGSGRQTERLELVAAPPQPELDYDLHDPRLQAVAKALTADERQIFMARGCERNWSDAAVSCGKPPKAGESVRRKVKRLSNGLINPAMAIDEPPMPPNSANPPPTHAGILA